jgi:DNA-binding MarR family transcriptional regulator
MKKAAEIVADLKCEESTKKILRILAALTSLEILAVFLLLVQLLQNLMAC